MNTINLRDEIGYCDYCGANSTGCNCYVLFHWHWTWPKDGYEIELLERILAWGANLAFIDAPPRFDGSVLNVLPINLSQELERYFLKVMLFDKEGFCCGVDMVWRSNDCADCSVTRRSVYDVLIRCAANEVKDTKQMRWPILSHFVIDYTEVENPIETRKRMDALLRPAVNDLKNLSPP